MESVAEMRSQRSPLGAPRGDVVLSSQAVLRAQQAYDPESGDGSADLLDSLGNLLLDIVTAVDDAESAGWLGFSEVVARASERLAQE